VSQILKREEETGGQMGIAEALITNANLPDRPTDAVKPAQIDIVTHDVCNEPGGIDPPLNDTCASDPIRIRGDVGCPGAQCRRGDDRWKMTVAHEIGHVIQMRATGDFFRQYRFGPTMMTRTDDPPGSPALCACGAVDSSNRWHCMQSIERVPGAVAEAFAHYFAARTWNDLTQANCTFPYYKEFLDTSCRPGVAPSDCRPSSDPAHVINPPPVPVDCFSPTRWRNLHCGGLPPLPPGDNSGASTVATMGVEFDWMGFYFNLTRPEVNAFSNHDLYTVYKFTCKRNGAAGDFCFFGVPGNIAWDDCHDPATCAVFEGGIHSTLEGLSQTPGSNVSLEMLRRFELLGRSFGVDRSTAP
jgi:hypothetical protein